MFVESKQMFFIIGNLLKFNSQERAVGGTSPIPLTAGRDRQAQRIKKRKRANHRFAPTGESKFIGINESVSHI